MLCVALALVFAGTTITSIINELHHAPGGSAVHEHMMLGELTIDDHADDHQAPTPEEGGAIDHLAGGHHHHGDAGWSILTPESAKIPVIAASGLRPGVGPEQEPAGQRVQGPERPPKAQTLNA